MVASCKKKVWEEEFQLLTGPSALELMSLLMCVCTGNGTVVRGHWEAWENIMENRPQSESGGGMGEIKTEGARLLQMKGKRLQWTLLCKAVCFPEMNTGDIVSLLC